MEIIDRLKEFDKSLTVEQVIDLLNEEERAKEKTLEKRIEEQYQKSIEFAKNYEKYRGKYIAIKNACWSVFVLKCKDIRPIRGAVCYRDLQIVPEGKIYHYNGTNDHENLKIVEEIVVDFGLSNREICELKDLNYWDKRPILMLLQSAKEIDNLFTEADVDKTIKD